MPPNQNSLVAELCNKLNQYLKEAEVKRIIRVAPLLIYFAEEADHSDGKDFPPGSIKKSAGH